MLHPGSWLSLFSPRGDFLPHALCLSTQPGLVWVHATADSLIAAAYYSIPFALAIFAWRRRDLTFRWMFVMFMLFIM
ncbi:MAG: PAS domain-containing sensor histidine kinase, partial [Rhodospirillales bacterium]|nr:PAS domain-containing sensor histidine kinase [Rhodospirillales bacterium]